MTSPLEVLLVHQGKEHAADSEVCVMPMGLLSMADWLQRHGHPTEILHVRVEQAVTPEFALPRAVAAVSPRLVCFDLHWHQQSRAVIDLVKEVREGAPDVVIVLGGYTASAFAAEILEQFPAVDYIIRGDGEIPLNALVEALPAETPLERVPNLCWRDQGRVRQNAIRHVNSAADLGRFTYSHFEHLRHHRYYTQAGVMEGEIRVRDPLAPGIFYCNCGRGCPNQCAYCAWSRGQHTLCRFSLERIASDLRWAVAHDFTEIAICDAAINFEDGLLAELCQNLGETAPKLQYACFVHWPLVTAEQIVHMAPLRWSRLMIGLQTDDDKGLALLGRDPFDAEQLERCVRLLRPLARPYLELITGIPGDTADGLRRRVEYALSLDCRVSMFPLLAARGTRLRNRVLAAGARIDPRQHVVTELPTLSGDEYRTVITELGALDLSADRLEIAGYDFLFRDKREEHSPARPATVLSRGWSIKHVRPEPQRVVIVVWHESAAEPLEFILTPRDAQAPCIAFSKEHNLGLIWEKEAACQLDDGQVEGLTALQRLLGLRTNAPK